MKPFMGWAFLGAMVLGWLSAADADDLPKLPKLQEAVRNQWVSFRIVNGRVAMDSSAGPLQIGTDNWQDQFAIQVNNGETRITDTWTNGKRQFSLEVTGGAKVGIQYSSKDGSLAVPIEYKQPLQGNIVLKIGPESKQEIYQGPGLWHLCLAYPDETKKYLSPLLDLLHPNWKISETAATIETELLRKAKNKETFDRKHWAALVEKLGSPTYAERQAAERELLSTNPAVLGYLRSLDSAHLDLEQQYRVQQIIEAWTERLNTDLPEQTAAMLMGDPSIWLIFLSRNDVETRRLAVHYLGILLEGPIDVDPEADPASQADQREKLRLRVEAAKE